MNAPRRVTIRAECDIVTARQHGREIAVAVGFTGSSITVIATAISEIARNIVTYAGEGEISIAPVASGVMHGVEVIATDRGPGIADVDRALEDGFSTGRGLGLGLPGARRLMDDFELASELGKGTTVRMRKWLR